MMEIEENNIYMPTITEILEAMDKKKKKTTVTLSNK